MEHKHLLFERQLQIAIVISKIYLKGLKVGVVSVEEIYFETRRSWNFGSLFNGNKDFGNQNFCYKFGGTNTF